MADGYLRYRFQYFTLPVPAYERSRSGGYVLTRKPSMWIPTQNLTGHLSDLVTNRDLGRLNRSYG
jgi:hypothetical protein